MGYLTTLTCLTMSFYHYFHLSFYLFPKIMALAMHSPLPKLDNKRSKLNPAWYHGCSHFCTINQSEEKNKRWKCLPCPTNSINNFFHPMYHPFHNSSKSTCIHLFLVPFKLPTHVFSPSNNHITPFPESPASFFTYVQQLKCYPL
jgi:hypothetical protein